MLRLAPFPRTLSWFARPQTRGLVSSALLSRAWQNETIADLRNEAKLRGLSAKGSRAALASRIEEHEKSLLHSANMATRQASSVSSTPSSHTTNTTEAPGNPEPPVVPPVPFMLDTKIPDLSLRKHLPPVQVPYVPDFWNSSTPAAPAIEEEVLPKVVVVAGAETHHGGGPIHSFLDLDAPFENIIFEGSVKSTRSDSFLDDITEDLGLPPVQDIKKGFSSLFK